MRAKNAPSQGRSRCPITKGSSSICATLSMVWLMSISLPCPLMTRLTSKGVRNTPSRVDKVALSTAAATCPRASAVIATDEDTVEGKTAR